MWEGGFEPPKALSHKISQSCFKSFYRTTDFLSLAHLTALELPLKTTEKKHYKSFTKALKNQKIVRYQLLDLRSKAEQIDAGFLDIEGHHTNRINGVRVKNHFFRPGYPCDLFDGLDGTGLVVAVHDRHEDGLVRDGVFYFFRPNPSTRVDGK